MGGKGGGGKVALWVSREREEGGTVKVASWVGVVGGREMEGGR